MIRSIAVFLDTSDLTPSLAYAAGLAQSHSAHLVGLWLPPHQLADPAVTFTRGATAMRAEIQRMTSAELEEEQNAVQSFSIESEQRGLTYEFRKLHSLRQAQPILSGADLIVASQMRGDIDTLPIEVATPVVMVPSGWKVAPAHTVVIGWNGSREAQRALRDSLPLLRRAGNVFVVMVDEAENSDVEKSAEGALHFLMRHGVPTKTETVASAGRGVAESLKHTADALHASLLVIGAYSHGRLREIVLGGTTRQLLKSASTPLFLAR